MLAIVHFVKYFRPYLWGRKVLIRTDHAALRYVKSMKELSDQFYRWIERLEEVEYTIEVRQSVNHGNADGLSRMLCGAKIVFVGLYSCWRQGKVDMMIMRLYSLNQHRQ